MRRRAASGAILVHLAWRGLVDRPLVSVLLAVAVAAAMGFQVANAANLAGYRDELLAQGITSGFGEVRLRPRRGGRLNHADTIASQVVERERIAAALPVLTLPGAVGRDGRFIGTAVSGLDQTAARRPFRIVEGSVVAPGDMDGVVLGTSLASQLGASVGDRVQLRLILGTGKTVLDEEDVGRFTLTVRGLATGAFGVCGAQVALVDRGFLDAQLGGDAAADLILVYSDAPSGARALAARLSEALPDLSARAWMDDSAFLGGAVRSSETLATVSRAMVVLAVLVPLWALMHVQVLHRRREVGVLCALGFAEVEVFGLFLLQAVLIGVAGVVLGAALGAGLVAWFQVHPLFAMEGFVVRPALGLGILLWPGALVLATATAAGAFPAWRAARSDPAQALRGVE